jgi:hypothetical protein
MGPKIEHPVAALRFDSGPPGIKVRLITIHNHATVFFEIRRSSIAAQFIISDL